MASVYILYSKSIERFYTGSCFDLLDRLEQHKNKVYEKSFTAKADDWELFFSIDGLAYKQARAIEAHIKKMKKNIYIQNLKKYPEMLEKLRQRFAV